jgi:uncharacterized metal-binding protein YceD (DUF177 family)
MIKNRDYEIAFVGLKPGIHEFVYKIEDKFFEAYQLQDFTNCQAEVKLQLDRQQSFLILKFEIGGSLEVSCDRCNNNLPMQLFDEFTITVKMVEDPSIFEGQDDDPDIYYISRTESHLRVADWIHEFINLSLPMLKVCTFEKMDGPYCNQKAKEILIKLEDEKKETKSENPIWKGLDKFRDSDLS